MHRTPAPVDEVAPLARVHRSRLAFAVAVTVAALPLIVLDNLPATAETNGAWVEVLTTAADESWSSEPPTSAPSTITTEAATTTVAAETTTSKAPTTANASVVQAVPAPAPIATVPPSTAPPSTAPPTTVPPSSDGTDPNDPATWDRLAQCESGGRWDLDSANGYYGGLQFSLATWRDVGGAGYPHQASRVEQIMRGQILQTRAGWGQWPHCSRELGYT